MAIIKLMHGELMPEYVYNADWSENPLMGFVTKFVIGGKDVAADQESKNPTAPTEKLMAVLVMDRILWTGGRSDSIFISGVISEASQRLIAEQTCGSDKTNTSVDCQFVVFKYDKSTSNGSPKYFEYFHTGTSAIKGLVKPGNLVLEDSARDGMPDETCHLELLLKPVAQLAQNFHYAIRAGWNMVEPWGPQIGG